MACIFAGVAARRVPNWGGGGLFFARFRLLFACFPPFFAPVFVYFGPFLWGVSLGLGPVSRGPSPCLQTGRRRARFACQIRGPFARLGLGFDRQLSILQAVAGCARGIVAGVFAGGRAYRRGVACAIV